MTSSSVVNLDLSKSISKIKDISELRTMYLIDEQHVLGKGRFGEVHRAREKTGAKRDVAIKFIDKRKLTTSKSSSGTTPYEQLVREVCIHSQLSHPNIVKCLDAFQCPSSCYIVLELINPSHGGNLFNFVTSKKYLPEDQARRYFQQMVLAVRYLHRNSIAHRDLKLDNVLLDDKGSSVVLVDLGLAKSLEQGALVTAVGTPVYLPPEVVSNVISEKNIHRQSAEYSLTADLWSLGVCLYSMLSGHYPFDVTQSHDKLFMAIYKKEYRMSSKIPKGAAELIAEGLLVDASKRWTIEQVLAHQWVRQDIDLLNHVDLNPPSGSVGAGGGGGSKAAQQKISYEEAKKELFK